MPHDIISPNEILETYSQTSSLNVEAFRIAVKNKKSKSYEKKVLTEISGSKTTTKNTIEAQLNRNTLPKTRFFPFNHRDDYMNTKTRIDRPTTLSSQLRLIKSQPSKPTKYTLHNDSQKAYHSLHVNKPYFRQTAKSRCKTFSCAESSGYNVSHHFLDGKDELLGYAPFTQPQRASDSSYL